MKQNLTKTNNTIFSKLPEHFFIGWAKYSFVIKKKLQDDHKNDCFGITDFNSTTIYLEEEMTDSQARHTIIHEVCHVLLESLGLGAPEEGDDVITSSNEIITETCARAMMLFKGLNPQLWKLLFEDYE